MAWNEPGNSGQDPWGSKPKAKSSGPHVDQLKAKLDQLMGSGGSGIPGGSSVMLGLVGVVGIIWLLTGIYIVDPAERGVVMTFGKFTEEVQAGPHWRWPSPIGSVEVVNVDQIRNTEIGYRSARANSQGGIPSVSSEALMLTQDENIVDIKIAVQYNVRSAKDYLFNVANPDETLQEAVESALRTVVGRNKMDFILTEGRNEIVARTKALSQEILDKYSTGLNILSVNLQDAQPPEQVQAAFADVVKAREDKQRFINEAEAYANDIIPKARGQASRVNEEAKAYKDQVIARAEGDAARFISVYDAYKLAPQITRERIYMDTIESVLSNASKVMVDAQGNNNMLYLPLDKLMNSTPSAPQVPQPLINQNTPSNLMDPATQSNTMQPRNVFRGREIR